MTLAGDRAGRIGRGVPLPRPAPWPRQSPLPPETAGGAKTLPVPALSVFDIREGLRAATRGLARRAEREGNPDVHEAISAAPGSSARALRGKPHAAGARRAASRGTRTTAHGRGGALKHMVQVRKRSA